MTVRSSVELRRPLRSATGERSARKRVRLQCAELGECKVAIAGTHACAGLETCVWLPLRHEARGLGLDDAT